MMRPRYKRRTFHLRGWSFLTLCAFGATGALVTLPAHAESEADRATARELAGRGNDALKKKDYEVAEDRFRRADALVHAPTLVVDHARALVGLGRFAEAYERYQLVLKEGVTASAPRGWKQAVKDAEREVQPLAAKIAWLTLSVKTQADAHVWMDGREVPAEDLGTRRPVDPGTRAITARAAGFLPKEVSLTLAAGADSALEIELDPAPPEPEPAAPAATSEIAVAAPPPAKDRMWIYVAYGVGAAGLVTGATAGVLALGVRSDINSECPDLHCTANTAEQLAHMNDQKSKYHTLGLVSGVGFALGLAGAATGTALLLMQNKTEKAPTASAHFVPYLGLRELGVTGRF